tara:strand:+ start:93 stop:620 length:528 start_codon:yes stop_codon:yes gene_type:complete
MPNTEGIESGLLPTMTVMDATLMTKGKAGANGRHSVQLSHLANTGALETENPIKTQDEFRAQGLTSKAERKMWATPRASDITAGRTLNEKGQRTSKTSANVFGANLADQVKMWPTPTRSMYKGGRKLETLKEAGRNETNSLPDAVNVVNQETGSLNPQWVEWLMGFPEGWTDLNN